MSMTLRLPDDPREYQQFFQDLLRSNDELRQQAELAQQQIQDAQQQAQDAQQQAQDASRRVAELQRVLDQTATDYDKLKEEHAELAEALALMRRYIFGRRHERFDDAPGQGHLFEIPEFIDEPHPTVPTAEDKPEPANPEGPRLRGGLGSTISITFISSTICPRVRKSAHAAVRRKHASAKTSRASST